MQKPYNLLLVPWKREISENYFSIGSQVTKLNIRRLIRLELVFEIETVVGAITT